MSDRALPIEDILTILTTTPPRLAALTAALAPARLRTPPGPDEWSAVEVLAHLRACEDQWGNAIRAILAADHPTIRAVNPTTWIKQTDYRELAFAPSLHAFTTQRAALLTVLAPLSPADWARGATVTGAGTPLELTVRSYAGRLARHERSHVKQIARLVKTLAG